MTAIINKEAIKGERGFAVIVIIGLIALFVIIAIVFAALSKQELYTAEASINSTKAKYLAEGALAYSISELKYGPGGARANAHDSLDENWSASPPQVLAIDLSNGVTGDLQATSIIDCASRINVNSHTALPSILNSMLNSLNIALGSPLSFSDVSNIVSNAPYEIKSQVSAVIGETKYDAVKDYITVAGYLDSKVIDPSNFSLRERAPVNINTASREVLIAVFNGIQANYVCPSCGGDGLYQWGYWTGSQTPLKKQTCPDCGGTGHLSLNQTEAQNLADYIITARASTPYKTWPQFYASIKNCSSIGTNDADLVMAVLNPNTGFDAAVREYGWAQQAGYVGKHKDPQSSARGLMSYTTEGCFDAGGYYEINTLGEVKNPAGTVIASRQIQAIVKVYDIYRQTDQYDFMSGNFNSNELCSHPEPVNAGVMPSSPYDGRMTLATITTSGSGATFRASFDDGLDADDSGGVATAYGNLVKDRLNNTTNPGDLLPDGVVMSVRRGSDLRYRSSGNLPAQGPGAETTVGMWLKPMWFGYDTMVYGDYTTVESDGWHWDTRGICRMAFQVFGGSNSPTDQGGIMQHWFTASSASRTTADGGCCGIVSLGHLDGEENKVTFISNRLDLKSWKPGQWRYIELHFEDNAAEGYQDWKWPYPPELMPFRDGTRYAWVNGWLQGEYGFDYMAAYDGTNTFNVGCDSQFANQVLNAVVDEVRVWPEAYPDDVSPANTMARYREGRYAPGTYNFTSSTFNPPGVDDVEWGTVTWTAYIPNHRLQNVTSGISLQVNDGSVTKGPWSNPAGGNVIGTSSSTIQYQAQFTLSSPLNNPVFNTPILDDVTITYLRPTDIMYYKEF